MHEITAKALSLAHDTFRCGVPYFRERKLIPIRTSAHLIVFDAERISPLYTMLKVRKEDAVVNREDNFFSGDVTLPDEFCTSEADYSQWNRDNPDFPVDKGHSAGSQYRRLNDGEQSDIDTLAGVTPEACKTNRNVKGPLESAILEYAKSQTHAYLVQGPVWFGDRPVNGVLRNGQWIPDAMFVSGLFLRKKSVDCWCWLMNNSQTIEGADLREVTLDDIEKLTGLYLWGNVGSSRFNERRSSLTGGDWWLSGQPAQ